MRVTLARRIEEAAAAVGARIPRPPRVAAILGSGLGAADLGIEEAVAVPYSAIPHMPRVSVAGHKGELVTGSIGTVPVAILSGRVHLYEGWSVQDVTFGVRVLARLGCRILLVTNAAGSTRPDLVPGTLVLVTDHINLTGEDPTRGPEPAEIGARFLGLTEAYDPRLGRILVRAAKAESIPLAQGIYCAGKGPCYETPAEVRMIAGLGADLVGMSTVPEVIAAVHAGMRVAAVSCVTNLAAGIEGSHPDHEEVKRVAGEASERLARIFRLFVPLAAEETS